eukprot:750743-Hanusia_phi.AAC.1
MKRQGVWENAEEEESDMRFKDGRRTVAELERLLLLLPSSSPPPLLKTSHPLLLSFSPSPRSSSPSVTGSAFFICTDQPPPPPADLDPQLKAVQEVRLGVLLVGKSSPVTKMKTLAASVNTAGPAPLEITPCTEMPSGRARPRLCGGPGAHRL